MYDWFYPNWKIELNGKTVSRSFAVKSATIELPHQQAEVKTASMNGVASGILSNDRSAQRGYFIEDVVKNHFP